MRAERIIGLVVIGALGGMLAWNCVLIAGDFRSGPADSPAVGGVLVGEPAPELNVARLDGGGADSLSARRGQVVLVDFWATWCAPCRESMPAVEKIWRGHGGPGFTVMSVNVEGPAVADKARAFVAGMGLTFPTFIDDGAASDAYHVDTIPTLLLVDRGGIVRWAHIGGLGPDDAADLERRVIELTR